MSEDATINLKKCSDTIKSAYELYTLIKTRYRLDPKSDNSHLEPLQEGMSLFKKRAEI